MAALRVLPFLAMLGVIIFFGISHLVEFFERIGRESEKNEIVQERETQIRTLTQDLTLPAWKGLNDGGVRFERPIALVILNNAGIEEIEFIEDYTNNKNPLTKIVFAKLVKTGTEKHIFVRNRNSFISNQEYISGEEEITIPVYSAATWVYDIETQTLEEWKYFNSGHISAETFGKKTTNNVGVVQYIELSQRNISHRAVYALRAEITESSYR